MALNSVLGHFARCCFLFLMLGLCFVFSGRSSFHSSFMGIAQASDAQHPVGSEEADAAALKTQGVPVKDTHAADSHAADSHAADSHAADSHAADSHAADSHAADAHEAKTHSVEKTEDKAAEATESKHTQESKDSHVSKEKAEPKSASVSHGLSWFVGVFALIAILVFLFT